MQQQQLDELVRACHVTLVNEMPEIMRLPVNERLERAGKRRVVQLARYADYERTSNGVDSASNVKKKKQVGYTAAGAAPGGRRRRHRPDGVKFVGTIALMDAVVRNDIEDGLFVCMFS